MKQIKKLLIKRNILHKKEDQVENKRRKICKKEEVIEDKKDACLGIVTKDMEYLSNSKSRRVIVG